MGIGGSIVDSRQSQPQTVQVGTEPILGASAQENRSLLHKCGHYTVIRDAQFVKAAKQVEVDAGDEAVFEFGIERLCHCPSRTALNMDNSG